jgi:hypothetical protein
MNKGIRQKIGGDSTKDKTGQNNVLYHLEAAFENPGDKQEGKVEDQEVERQLAEKSETIPDIVVQAEKPVQRQIPLVSQLIYMLQQIRQQGIQDFASSASDGDVLVMGSMVRLDSPTRFRPSILCRRKS